MALKADKQTRRSTQQAASLAPLLWRPAAVRQLVSLTKDSLQALSRAGVLVRVNVAQPGAKRAAWRYTAASVAAFAQRGVEGPPPASKG